MNNISDIKNCYGCGVCAAACPRNIIQIRLNKKGFYEPYIKDFYIATIDLDSKEPLLKIFANTVNRITPVREFNFKLNAKGEVYRIK